MFGIGYRSEIKKLNGSIDRLVSICAKQQEQLDLLDELIAGRTVFDVHLCKHLGLNWNGSSFDKTKKVVKKSGK